MFFSLLKAFEDELKKERRKSATFDTGNTGIHSGVYETMSDVWDF